MSKAVLESGQLDHAAWFMQVLKIRYQTQRVNMSMLPYRHDPWLPCPTGSIARTFRKRTVDKNYIRIHRNSEALIKH